MCRRARGKEKGRLRPKSKTLSFEQKLCKAEPFSIFIKKKFTADAFDKGRADNGEQNYDCCSVKLDAGEWLNVYVMWAVTSVGACWCSKVRTDKHHISGALSSLIDDLWHWSMTAQPPSTISNCRDSWGGWPFTHKLPIIDGFPNVVVDSSSCEGSCLVIKFVIRFNFLSNPLKCFCGKPHKPSQLVKTSAINGVL